MNTLTLTLQRWPTRQPVLFLVLAAAVWWGLYQTLLPGSEALVAAMPVNRASHLGGALDHRPLENGSLPGGLGARHAQDFSPV